jgi:hypothetical protein
MLELDDDLAATGTLMSLRASAWDDAVNRLAPETVGRWTRAQRDQGRGRREPAPPVTAGTATRRSQRRHGWPRIRHP